LRRKRRQLSKQQRRLPKLQKEQQGLAVALEVIEVGSEEEGGAQEEETQQDVPTLK
jgi:hypothetical protein